MLPRLGDRFRIENAPFLDETPALTRRTHGLFDEHFDVATATLLENWIDEVETCIWYLFEASRVRGDR
jgi:hypothetical protein